MVAAMYDSISPSCRIYHHCRILYTNIKPHIRVTWNMKNTILQTQTALSISTCTGAICQNTFEKYVKNYLIKWLVISSSMNQLYIYIYIICRFLAQPMRDYMCNRKQMWEMRWMFHQWLQLFLKNHRLTNIIDDSPANWKQLMRLHCVSLL